MRLSEFFKIGAEAKFHIKLNMGFLMYYKILYKELRNEKRKYTKTL